MTTLSNEKNFPIIDLGDYILREKSENDVVNFFNYYSDPEVNRYILCEIPQDLEGARRELYYWRNVFYRGDGVYFAIARKDTNQLIGSIGLTSLNKYHNRIEISYDLAKQYWRQGITSKAIQAVSKYAFEMMNVNRVEAFTSVDNIASEKLLIKNGYTLEGTLRQHRYHKGNYVNAYVFSLLRSEFN